MKKLKADILAINAATGELMSLISNIYFRSINSFKKMKFQTEILIYLKKAKINFL